MERHACVVYRLYDGLCQDLDEEPGCIELHIFFEYALTQIMNDGDSTSVGYQGSKADAGDQPLSDI